MMPVGAIHRIEIETPGIAGMHKRVVTQMTSKRHPA
ncbi:MAG: hypothetical protein QOJ54_2086 [Aliidongia sp.]|jgi:hypothetical protein|nr:hypothetical protein [Aliidongia sp.]